MMNPKPWSVPELDPDAEEEKKSAAKSGKKSTDICSKI